MNVFTVKLADSRGISVPESQVMITGWTIHDCLKGVARWVKEKDPEGSWVVEVHITPTSGFEHVNEEDYRNV